jgi:hypothetical protein
VISIMTSRTLSKLAIFPEAERGILIGTLPAMPGTKFERIQQQILAREHPAVAPRRIQGRFEQFLLALADHHNEGNRIRQRNEVTESGTDRGVGGRGRRRGGASEAAAGGVVAWSAKEQQRGGVREEERGTQSATCPLEQAASIGPAICEEPGGE